MLSNDAKQKNKQEIFRELHGRWKTGVGKWHFDGESGTTPLLKGVSTHNSMDNVDEESESISLHFTNCNLFQPSCYNDAVNLLKSPTLAQMKRYLPTPLGN